MAPVTRDKISVAKKSKIKKMLEWVKNGARISVTKVREKQLVQLN